MSASRSMVSVVVPVFNGADLVGDLHDALVPVLDGLDADTEVVYVDDGSSDGSLGALEALQRGDPRVRIVELAMNFGQHAALSAGFDHARGACIVTMDADLQCDPRDMPRLLAPLKDGYDLVSGVRQGRQDPLLRRVLSRSVNYLVTQMAGVRLKDVGCPYNALTADLAHHIAAFGELRRFLKPLAVRLARRVAEVEVTHRPRPSRKPGSSYSSTGLIRLFMDFLVNACGDVFAWIFVASLAMGGVSLLAAAGAGVMALGGSITPAMPLALFALSIAAFLLALAGLAGDYVQRIYRQSSRRPFYFVRRVHEAVPAPAGALHGDFGVRPAVASGSAATPGGIGGD